MAVSVIRSVALTSSSRAFIAAVRSARSRCLELAHGRNASPRAYRSNTGLGLRSARPPPASPRSRYAAGIERRRWTLREATLPVLAAGRPAAARAARLRPAHDARASTASSAGSPSWPSSSPISSSTPATTSPTSTPSRPCSPRSARCSTARASSCSAATTTSAPRPRTRPATCAETRSATHGVPLPWRDLRAALRRARLARRHARQRHVDGDGQQVAAAGVDDPHLAWTATTASPARWPTRADLRLGLTHSPEPRVLDGFAADGYDLVLAGHTHGGQLRMPGYGAIVTNCGIDRSRARGASRWGAHTLAARLRGPGHLAVRRRSGSPAPRRRAC